MISPCRSATYRVNAGLLLAALCLGMVATPPGAAAAPSTALLQPTPLILKDGRIAEVSVHVVPFQVGRPEVGPAAAGDLASITRAVATDCFLTAQIIGHVAPTEVAENDSLGAHRLARSRADAIQASLIGGGLPAKAIASVWDWQFMVPEPRATLWLFSLTEGEDCDGRPLPGASDRVAERETGDARPQSAAAPTAPDVAVAAAVDRPAPAAPPSAGAKPTVERAAERPAPSRQAEPERPAESGDALAARPEPEAVPAGAAITQAAAPKETREIPAASPAEIPTEVPAEHAAQTAPAERTTVARATPPTAPTPRARRPATPSDAAKSEPARGEAAGSGAAGSQTARTEAEAATRPAVPTEGGLVITFATNSSYFTPGTSKELRSLIRRMAAGERYKVILQAGVSASEKVVGASTPEEARRYNRWLAERRVERVQTWLNENAAGAQLVIEPEYLLGNEERAVVVRIAPAA